MRMLLSAETELPPSCESKRAISLAPVVIPSCNSEGGSGGALSESISDFALGLLLKITSASAAVAAPPTPSVRLPSKFRRALIFGPINSKLSAAIVPLSRSEVVKVTAARGALAMMLPSLSRNTKF